MRWLDVHTAAYVGDAAWMERLLAEDASLVHATDSCRRSPMAQPTYMRPLHLAAASGHVDVIRVLLRFGSDTTARDRSQRVPLHLATIRARTQAVRELVRGKSCDALLRDSAAKRPLDYALEQGTSELELLSVLQAATRRAEVVHLCCKLRDILEGPTASSLLSARKANDVPPPQLHWLSESETRLQSSGLSSVLQWVLMQTDCVVYQHIVGFL